MCVVRKVDRTRRPPRRRAKSSSRVDILTAVTVIYDSSTGEVDLSYDSRVKQIACRAQALQMAAQFSGEKLDRDPFEIAADEAIELAEPSLAGEEDEGKALAARLARLYGR